MAHGAEDNHGHSATACAERKGREGGLDACQVPKHLFEQSFSLTKEQKVQSDTLARNMNDQQCAGQSMKFDMLISTPASRTTEAMAPAQSEQTPPSFSTCVSIAR